MNKFTIKQAVDFILKNRKNKVFRDWTPDTIAVALNEAFGNKEAIYSVNPFTEQLNGIAIGESNKDYKLLHVSEILTTEKGVLKKLIIKFMELYPGWDIQANRHERLIRYKNTPKLINKIYNLT